MNKQSNLQIIVKSLDNNSLKKSIKDIMVNCPPLSEKVFLKANMYGFPYKKGVTTHPEVITKVANYLNEIGHKVYVGDIIPIKNIDFEEYFHNYNSPKNVEFVNLNEEKDLITIVRGKFQFRFPKLIYNNEIINIPVLKTHSEALLSCAIKNMMGLLPKTADRENIHKIGLGEGIKKLYSVIKKQIKYNIVDGVYIMEGNGPVFGNVKYKGIVFAGESGTSIDSYAHSFINTNILPIYMKKLTKYKLEGDKIKLNLRMPNQLNKEYYTGNPSIGESGVFEVMINAIIDKIGSNINFVFKRGKRDHGKINIGVNVENCDYFIKGNPPSRREIRKVFNIGKN